MRKILFIILFILLSSILYYFLFVKANSEEINRKNIKEKEQVITQLPTLTPTLEKKEVIETNSIFIPYWSDFSKDNDFSAYDKVFYFGIGASEQGISTSDQGYIKLKDYNGLSLNKAQKYLVLRMLDTDVNLSVLKNSQAQDTIVEEVVSLAIENGFSGIALDLELNNLPVTDNTSKITNFVSKLYTKTAQNDLNFNLILYGDNFYKKRQFDLSTLVNNVDGVVVMAYDFSKASGEPGPNFPFDKKDKYGYDFKQMVSDYLTYVPGEKLTIAFGMFGYDWNVDENQRPIKQAQSISLNEIKQKYLDKCIWKDCVVKRDSETKETEIDYVTSQIVDNFANLYYHIVWFEDEASVQVKENYLKEKGIGNYAYWAWGYY